MYRFALAGVGFRVQEAADGLSALASLDREPIELVVLDLALSEVEGQDVVQEIAAQAHTRNVPVLIVTSATEHVDARALDCVVSKPVSPDTLVRAVLKCLGSGPGDAGAGG